MIPQFMAWIDRLNPISQACATIIDVPNFQFKEKGNMFNVGTSMGNPLVLLLLENFIYLKGYLSLHLHV